MIIELLLREKVRKMKDPIIAEVRAVREKLAARFNFDVKAICENARKNQKKSGHKVVSFAGKRKNLI